MTGTSLRRAVVGAAVLGGTTAAASGAGSLALAAYFARKVLTPDAERPDDVLVREVRSRTVVLDADEATVAPGRYGLWLDGGAGHVRLGEVLEVASERGTVERVVLGLDAGQLRPGPARWNTWHFALPPDRALGIPYVEVVVPGELGDLPAWLMPPGDSTDVGNTSTEPGTGSRWAVLVHGRGARREETLRALPPLRRAGLTCLSITYRNDDGVAPGPDGRYNLGLSEWRDVEAAIRYAVGSGAREVVLVGWSMGGGIVLQLLDRSPLREVVSRVVLDAPVVDWADVLVHHARLHRLPPPVAGLSTTMMGRRWGRRLVGVHEAVDVARTDWVARADQLRHPVLLIHSADDEFVPVGPSRALASRRPDLVRFEEWRDARHCCEWNTEPQRWERVVEDWVSG